MIILNETDFDKAINVIAEAGNMKNIPTFSYSVLNNYISGSVYADSRSPKTVDGVKKIYINVEKDNEIGKTFYEAKGFEIVKEFDDEFDGHILKTVRMAFKV